MRMNRTNFDCDANSSNPAVTSSNLSTGLREHSHHRAHPNGKNGTASKLVCTEESKQLSSCVDSSVQSWQFLQSGVPMWREARCSMSDLVDAGSKNASVEATQASQLSTSIGGSDEEKPQQYTTPSPSVDTTGTNHKALNLQHGLNFVQQFASSRFNSVEKSEAMPSSAGLVSSSGDSPSTQSWHPFPKLDDQPFKDDKFITEVPSSSSSPSTSSSKFVNLEKCDVSSSKRASEPIKGEEKQDCQVCGDMAAGFHCGAYVCEACKKFFVRCLKQDSGGRFVCSRKSACVITRETRTQCQHCRFKKCVSLGMYKPGTWPGGDVNTNISGIPCKVCSGASTGYHFGAITCEGCKGFFRRTVKERDGLKYVCTRGGDCTITMATRNICKYCRYQKCLAVGMTPDGSRIGRQPNSIKHATMLEIKNLHDKGELIHKPVVVKEEVLDEEDDGKVAGDTVITGQSMNDKTLVTGKRSPCEISLDAGSVKAGAQVSTHCLPKKRADITVPDSLSVMYRDKVRQQASGAACNSKAAASVSHGAHHFPHSESPTLDSDNSVPVSVPQAILHQTFGPAKTSLDHPLVPPAGYARFDRLQSTSSSLAKPHLPSLASAACPTAINLPFASPSCHQSSVHPHPLDATSHRPVPSAAFLPSSHMHHQDCHATCKQMPGSEELCSGPLTVDQDQTPGLLDEPVSGQRHDLMSPTTEINLIHQLNGKLQMTRPRQMAGDEHMETKARSRLAFPPSQPPITPYHPHPAFSSAGSAAFQSHFPNVTYCSSLPEPRFTSALDPLVRMSQLNASFSQPPIDLSSHPHQHPAPTTNHPAGFTRDVPPYHYDNSASSAESTSFAAHHEALQPPIPDKIPTQQYMPLLERQTARQMDITQQISRSIIDDQVAGPSKRPASDNSAAVPVDASLKMSDPTDREYCEISGTPKRHLPCEEQELAAKKDSSMRAEDSASEALQQAKVIEQVLPSEYQSRDLIEVISKSLKHLEVIVNRSPDSAYLNENSTLMEIWTSIMNQFTQCAHATLKFAKSIPGFRKFPITTQITKVQSAMYPIVLCLLSTKFDLETMTYCYFAMARSEEEAVLRSFPVFKPIKSHLREVGLHFKQNNLSDIEVGFLCALTLESVMNVGENDLQHHLILALKAYCEDMHADGLARQVLLLDILDCLQKANNDHLQSVIEAKQLYPHLEIPQLFRETFLSD